MHVPIPLYIASIDERLVPNHYIYALLFIVVDRCHTTGGFMNASCSFVVIFIRSHNYVVIR